MTINRQTGSGSSAIDLDVLENLARDAGADAMPALISSFIRDCARRESEIAAALEDKDLAKLEAQSHALTSSAQTFGATTLADLTRAIENACRRGLAEDAFSRATILPDVAAAARQAMTTQSERYAADGLGE